VTCITCDTDIPTSGRKQLVRLGWLLTGKPGWQCPACRPSGGQVVGVHGGVREGTTQDHPSSPTDRTGLG